MPLSPEDQLQAAAAEGYLTLGLFAEAEISLTQLSAAAQASPEVLMVRVQLYQATQQWAKLQAAAVQLATMEPFDPQWIITLAFATRRANSIPAAKLILEAAMVTFTEEPLIPYNLACYECQLGDVPAAKKLLERALRMQPKMGPMALEDSDLEPLWATLQHDFSNP